MNWIWSLQDFF